MSLPCQRFKSILLEQDIEMLLLNLYYLTHQRNKDYKDVKHIEECEDQTSKLYMIDIENKLFSFC